MRLGTSTPDVELDRRLKSERSKDIIENNGKGSSTKILRSKGAQSEIYLRSWFWGLRVHRKIHASSDTYLRSNNLYRPGTQGVGLGKQIGSIFLSSITSVLAGIGLGSAPPMGPEPE